MGGTIKIRTLAGLALIALAGWIQFAKPTLPDWPWNVGGGTSPMAGISSPHVVVFHESSVGSQGLPSWWNSDAEGGVRRWLEANAKGNWRLFDKDTPLDSQGEWVKQARKSFDEKHGTDLPWIVYGNGHKGGTSKLPATAADTLKLLEPLK